MTLADDRDEIRQLVNRYAMAVDNRDEKVLPKLFTEDGVLDVLGGPYSGPEALRAFAASVPPDLVHVVANEIIDVDGDEAHGQVYTLVLYGSPKAVAMTGSYTDTLRRGPDGWRFSLRVFQAH